ncbi:hypothetical protein AB1L88_21430 [Tautonia sp. JC769]|uniref:hypothetical protein n=1 Tax=Tautonia sp. JC769 TaxID=3232135 RepID=UPI0034585F82
MPKSRRGGRWTHVGWGVVFVAICLAPHGLRLASPSLYSDDVIRVGAARVMAPSEVLASPFNEHVAPFFNLVTLVAWACTGGHLEAAPMAYTVASLIPFGLCAAGLGVLIRFETGSSATALVVSAWFALSTVHLEAAWWYSASSFSWALFWTLATWMGARAAARRPSRPRLVVTAVAACLAPMCSAIGVLAGPIGSLRSFSGSREGRPPLQVATLAAVPMLGTLAYFLGVRLLGSQDSIAEGIRANGQFARGFRLACQAPAGVLLPRTLGLGDVVGDLPTGVAMALGLIGLIAAIGLARRAPRRPLIVGGLALLLGGYALTYGFRSIEEPRWLFAVQRYHLFPLAGLLLVTAPLLREMLHRFDHRPGRALRAAGCIALCLLFLNIGSFGKGLAAYRFAAQAETLSAVVRLEALCRREGISRDQALSTLGPIRPRWYPNAWGGALELMGPTVASPVVSDAMVGDVLRSCLSLDDLEALCGGKDVTEALRPAPDPRGDGRTTPAVGRRVDSHRIEPSESTDTGLSLGWPSYVDYEFPRRLGDLSAPIILELPAWSRVGRGSLWWSGDGSDWSESRSICWNRPAGDLRDRLILALDEVPHWSFGRSRYMRVVIATPGPLRIGPPRFSEHGD